MRNNNDGLTVAEREESMQARRLWVPRRRVPVRVQLADQAVLTGELYADVCSLDGTPGRVVDRLNDSQEPYLPLATDNRHILLKKVGIVTVQFVGDEHERKFSDADGSREIKVHVRLSVGMTLKGSIHTLLAPQARLLDYLNSSREKFSVLCSDGQVTLVNSDYVVAVAEIRDPD